MSRSASRLLFVNTMDDVCCSTRSTMPSSTCGQMDPCCGWSPCAADPSSGAVVPSSVMSSTGTMTRRSNSFVFFGDTIETGERPPRNRATSSGGRTVADSPMRWAGFSSSASSRSSESARWLPRLVAATACTSSTMTVSTPASVSRAAEVSMRNSDSGVVMRMSGGVFASERRSPAGVSPERTPTVTSGGSAPSRFAVCTMPTSGERRLRSTSTASAFSGEM
ncbi:hypothetical protein CMMCAS05_02360 [Clavibacter michiganensis subsp. michiganensis]|nr:hypothetical protein CMMCAS05_02360 [Clavibacter michiganensis subsp. michiganensis]